MKYTINFDGKPDSPVELTLSMTVSEWEKFKGGEVAEAIERHVMAGAKKREEAKELCMMAAAIQREEQAAYWNHPDITPHAAGWPHCEAIEGLPGVI